MKITKNFSKNEFDSKDGASMPDSVLKNIKCLAINLQVLRDSIDKPISINSGYRSPSHNKRVGGSPNSQHLKGNAGDLRVPGMKPIQLYKQIEKLIDEGVMLQGGLGLYDTFVHYDKRGTKARWDFRTKK